MKPTPPTHRLLAPLVGLGLLGASPASAAPDFDVHQSGGVLGHALVYELTGERGDSYLLLPSLTTGPTPIDGFLLAVGLDLAAAWSAGVFGPGGESAQAYVVPANPVLSGVPLHAQALTFELLPFPVVTEVSNAVSVTLSGEGETTNPLGEQNDSRRYCSIIFTPKCRPTLAGGQSATVPPAYLDTVEYYDPQTEEFHSAGTLAGGPRAFSTATLLDDGRILIAGGVGPGPTVLASAVLYDPETETSTAVGALNEARVFHTATLLADGRVLVVGGSSAFDEGNSLGHPSAFTGALRGTTELYDPVSQTWSFGPPLPRPRTQHRASRYRDAGRVLVTGGVEAVLAGRETTDGCLYYVPAPPGPGAFAPAPFLPAPRACHGQTRTADGGALVSGGAHFDFGLPSAPGTADNFVLPPGGGAVWTSGATNPGIVDNGETICVESKSPWGPVINYVAGGGMRSFDLALAADGPVATDLYAIDATLATSVLAGTLSSDRVGARLGDADGGFRVLVVGAGPSPPGDPDRTADLVTRPY